MPDNTSKGDLMQLNKTEIYTPTALMNNRIAFLSRSLMS